MDTIMILSVKVEKKRSKRYLIYSNREEPILTIHEDIWIKHRLMKGVELTAEQIVAIQAEDDSYAAYLAAISYLGARPRTMKQIQGYLMRKEHEEQHIRHALERLEMEKIVDDEVYAQQFASSRIKNGLKGSRYILQELRQQGVSQEAAYAALSQLDRESEQESAQLLAEKKWRSLKGEVRLRRQKLQQFLLRRGFPGDIVREVMKNAQFHTNEEQIQEEDGLWLDN